MPLKYETLEEAIRDNPGPLLIELATNIFGGQRMMYLRKPGPTARSKPIDILAVALVAGEGEGWPELLRSLARGIELAN